MSDLLQRLDDITAPVSLDNGKAGEGFEMQHQQSCVS